MPVSRPPSIARALALHERAVAALDSHDLAAAERFARRALAGLEAHLGRRPTRLARASTAPALPRARTSDMAERSHAVHQIRQLPELGGELVRVASALVLTAAGIVWLDPAGAPWALIATAAALLLPLAAQPVLTERDLRLRSHAAALGRYYLDALLGLLAVRAHGAERSVRREHEALLVDWVRAGRGRQRAAVAVEAAQLLTGFGAAAGLLLHHIGRGGEAGGALLLVYWALQLPVLGEELAQLAWQYPGHRNLTLRLLEPLGASEAGGAVTASGASETATQDPVRGVAIGFEGVRVVASGRTILEGVDLDVPAGSHVAIVGPSGAGKSSLVGLLLGWHLPDAGRVVVDGQLLESEALARLRQRTAWVDPAVQLWNRSLLDNLAYGAGPDAPARIGWAVAATDLRSLVEKLPEGLQSPLGEGGGLVSGGEGQRIRLARAMLRPRVALAILDEPCRGLDREQRGEQLRRARELWREATLLCVTHDVAETGSFDRVLVVEAGRLVEDGAPRELRARPGSRYAALLAAEESLRERTWAASSWRRIRMAAGRLVEADSPGGGA